jgi:hypothetical protein
VSLPARQERVLERIEHSLHASDPLRSMFAMFAKLTRDEEMPRLEKLQAPVIAAVGLAQATGAARKRATDDGKHVGHRRAGHQAARDHTRSDRAPGAGTCRLGLGMHGVSHCDPAFRPQHTAPALNWAKTCRPAPHELRTRDCQAGDSALPASGGTAGVMRDAPGGDWLVA